MDEPESRARLVVVSPLAAGQTVELSRAQAAHARARRLSAGDVVTLVDGSGIEGRGRIRKLGRAGGEVAVERVSKTESSGSGIDLLVSGLRPSRLAWISEKATELGASRLVLVQTSRTQSFRGGPAAVARMSRVAQEAAKQCGSARWPEIVGPVVFDEALSLGSGCARIFLDFGGEPFPASLPPPVAILIGPEGGWTQRERAAAQAARWTPIALPAGKLRAETAAIAALVLARAAIDRRGE